MATQLKKGKYYIGDPCYVFGNSWSDVLNETHFFNDEQCKIKGKTVVGGGTAYGDGTYEDNKGRKYWVDAGLIAILPISLLKIDNKKTIKEIEESEGMHIVNFKEDFTAECANGKYRFGDIEINTAEDEEDEDE